MSPRTKATDPDFNSAPDQSDSSFEAKWNIFNAAAKKGDRWWFFALLMIGMAYVGYERWESSKERDIMRLEITSVRDSQLLFLTQKNDAMMSALLNNTRALEANTLMLNRIENRRTE